jgi:hypothetical protein
LGKKKHFANNKTMCKSNVIDTCPFITHWSISSLKIPKNTNSDHQIQQFGLAKENKSSGLHSTIYSTLKIMVPFYYFH